MTSQETRGRLSKEAIYEDATRKELGSNPNGTRMDVVSRAMDMYAQQEEISFAEWIIHNNYGCEYIEGFGEVIWREDDDPDAVHTTPQLYQIFLKSQTT